MYREGQRCDRSGEDDSRILDRRRARLPRCIDRRQRIELYSCIVREMMLRILLAVSLAFWSPAWCCCAVRASVTGSDASSLDLPSCCAARAGAKTSVSAAASSAGMLCRLGGAMHKCGDEAGESSCTCDQRKGDEHRLDTSSSVSNPRLDMMPAMPAPLSQQVVGSSLSFDLIRAAFDEALDRPPPRRTLLQHHVLLLI